MGYLICDPANRKFDVVVIYACSKGSVDGSGRSPHAELQKWMAI